MKRQKAARKTKKSPKRAAPASPSARREARAGREKDGRAPGANPRRVRAILEKLDQAYPNANCALVHQNAFQLLIATILSAQATDVGVNKVTPVLFQAYPTPEALAYANPRDVEAIIHTTGFFRSKTKSIIGASKKIVEEFAGKVPRTMDELLTLPGVARKTANVVLGTAFGIAVGVVVDTHVLRVSYRLDLTRNTEPKKVEQDLMKAIPPDHWILFSHQLIWHGRRVCQARRPRCIDCNLERLCYSSDKTV